MANAPKSAEVDAVRSGGAGPPDSVIPTGPRPPFRRAQEKP